MDRLRPDDAGDELCHEQAEENAGLAHRERQVDEDDDGEGRLRGGKEQLLALLADDRKTVQASCRDGERDRERPHEQCPLVDFRRHERTERRVRVEPPREQTGDEQLRRLRCQRREPLHEEKLADAERGAGLPEGVGEVLGAQQDDAGGDEEQREHRCSPLGDAEAADPARRADEVGLLGRRPRDADCVKQEQADEHGGIDQGDRTAEAAGSASRRWRPRGRPARRCGSARA